MTMKSMICHHPTEVAILVNAQTAQVFAQRQGVTDTAMIIVIMPIVILMTVIVAVTMLIL